MKEKCVRKFPPSFYAAASIYTRLVWLRGRVFDGYSEERGVINPTFWTVLGNCTTLRWTVNTLRIVPEPSRCAF